MKHLFEYILIVIEILGLITLIVWNIILNWDTHIGIKEYPIMYWVLVLIFVIICLYMNFKNNKL